MNLHRRVLRHIVKTLEANQAWFDFWDFSTNAVTPVSLGIPTIGFGPGEYKLAHMRNENCKVDQIIEACGFYARLIDKI
jgi:acetylornithine deacetylase/succinyl-diaminopimelate desuccinylase-like protein